MLKALKAKLTPNKRMGDRAEDMAKTYLQKKGLGFITQNYHSRRGEIDLIFQEGDKTLIFVEVKYRSDAQFGHADEMVTIHKQRKIIKAASAYLQEKKLTEAVIVRFDVVAIEPNKQATSNDAESSLSIQWIQNAFQAH